MASWTTERKVELALAVERAARAPEGVSQVENAVYSDAEGAAAIANSRGFAASYRATQAWAYASAFAGEGEDLMTGMGIGLGRDPGELDAEAIGAEAADRALDARGRPPAREPPLPRGARRVRGGLLRRASSARCCPRTPCSGAARCSPGGRATRSPSPRSCWSTTARHPDGPASAPFDGEGSPTRRTPLIEHGKLAGLPLRRADRAQGRPRDHGQRRPRLLPHPAVGGHARTCWSSRAAATLEELVAQAGDGLYVTDVAGLHSGVNPVSGTFSVGASGRLIEGGRAGRPGEGDHHRQRPRRDAPLRGRGGVREPLGTPRRERKSRSNAGFRDGRFGHINAQIAGFILPKARSRAVLGSVVRRRC